MFVFFQTSVPVPAPRSGESFQTPGTCPREHVLYVPLLEWLIVREIPESCGGQSCYCSATAPRYHIVTMREPSC